MTERRPDWEALRRAYAHALRAPEEAGRALGATARPAPPSAPPSAPGARGARADDTALARELAEERAAIMLEAGDVSEAEVRAYLLGRYGVFPGRRSES